MDKLLRGLEVVVKYNEEQMRKANGDQSRAKNLITLEYEGMSIYNPFYDESMMHSVDPIKYYGLDKITRMISKLK